LPGRGSIPLGQKEQYAKGCLRHKENGGGERLAGSALLAGPRPIRGYLGKAGRFDQSLPWSTSAKDSASLSMRTTPSGFMPQYQRLT